MAQSLRDIEGLAARIERLLDRVIGSSRNRRQRRGTFRVKANSQAPLGPSHIHKPIVADASSRPSTNADQNPKPHC